MVVLSAYSIAENPTKMAGLGPCQPEAKGFPSSSMVKNPPAKQPMWVSSLGREDPLEKEMATPTPVFLPEKIPWTETGAGQGKAHGVTKSQT